MLLAKRALYSLGKRASLSIVEVEEVVEQAWHIRFQVQARDLVPYGASDAVSHVRNSAGVKASAGPELGGCCSNFPPKLGCDCREILLNEAAVDNNVV